MNTIRLPGNLYYLMEKFPPRYGVYKKVAERLNTKGKVSSSGMPYSETIVNNIVRGQHKDDKVRLELLLMIAELDGKTSEVSALLDKAEMLLNLQPQLAEAEPA